MLSSKCLLFLWPVSKLEENMLSAVREYLYPTYIYFFIYNSVNTT